MAACSMASSKEAPGTQWDVKGLEIRLTWCQVLLYQTAAVGLYQATESPLNLSCLLVR